MKATKYGPDDEGRGLHAVTAAVRRLGAGNPPLHRLRVGLAFVMSGHREVDGMIARHARLARTFAEELGLPQAVLEGVGGAYERWDGRGWPGRRA